MTETARPVLGLILKGYPRISETFISNEIMLLEELGFTIRLFSMRRPREAFSHESVKRIKARVDYLPSTIRGSVPRLLRANLALALKRPRAYARAARHAWRRYRRTRKTATIKHLLQAGYLVHDLLPGSGVGHLHAHFAHSPTSVAMFASMLSGLRFSFTAHAKDIYTSDPRQLAEKIKMAAFVVTCTEYNRRHLMELSPGTEVHRVYHGIDVSFFQGREKKAGPRPPYRILTVARITPKKGLPTVYRAVKLLRDQGLDVRHTLIGDGDDRDRILALIRELGLEDWTEWLGTLPHEAVLEQYRRADLFVLGCEVAANGDRDGIPNVLVESLAMGLPAAATDVSAIPELIRPEKTGLLVRPGDPAALAEAMTRLLTDQDLRAGLIEAGRAKVEQDFDNKTLIKSLADIYRRYGAG